MIAVKVITQPQKNKSKFFNEFLSNEFIRVFSTNIFLNTSLHLNDRSMKNNTQNNYNKFSFQNVFKFQNDF